MILSIPLESPLALAIPQNPRNVDLPEQNIELLDSFDHQAKVAIEKLLHTKPPWLDIEIVIVVRISPKSSPWKDINTVPPTPQTNIFCIPLF